MQTIVWSAEEVSTAQGRSCVIYLLTSLSLSPMDDGSRYWWHIRDCIFFNNTKCLNKNLCESAFQKRGKEAQTMDRTRAKWPSAFVYGKKFCGSGKSCTHTLPRGSTSWVYLRVQCSWPSQGWIVNFRSPCCGFHPNINRTKTMPVK